MISQLRPLLALRWQMVRSPQARWGFGVLAAMIPLLSLGAVAVALLAPRERSLDITLLVPTAYLSVAILAVFAPLVAGGGNELYPAEQLVGYPISARTQYVASIALTPLNLAWTTQLVGLIGLTAYAGGRTVLMPLALATCLTYVALVTLAGQALAWAVTGFRHRRNGRRATWALAAVLVLGALELVLSGDLGRFLDASPTVAVVTGAVAGANGSFELWSRTTGIMIALTFVADWVGRRLCTWALRQPGDETGPIDSRVVRRRTQRGNDRRELLATDRASVWRSPSLRRGLLVLGILPGAVAAVAGLDWPSLVLLPGLVAAGAGLLFGVNAFCLDGTGSVWLASLPTRPAVAYWSKAQVVAETCMVAIVTTVLAGSARAGRLPTSAEAAALGACAVVALLRVVATCMELSVTRPHRSELRGPRDTPAPPGVMAAYSARLAVSTTLIAVLFSALAEVASWEWPVLLAIPFVLLSLRRLVATSGQWHDALVRSRVVTTVASG